MTHLDEPIKEVVELKNYINGEWVKSKSEQVLDIINPATQKIIAKVPMSTKDEADATVKAAKEAFPEWRRTTPVARARFIYYNNPKDRVPRAWPVGIYECIKEENYRNCLHSYALSLVCQKLSMMPSSKSILL